jgi:hypothetical protein
MNYECLLKPEEDIWVTCTIIDNSTSPTHLFVRLEDPTGPRHAWIKNEYVRQLQTGL